MSEQTHESSQNGSETRTNAMNARVAQVRQGLEKAVTGREERIKDIALDWAEKLDAKTEGRHHNKIRVALEAVKFVVDNVSKNKPGVDARGSAAGHADSEPEYVGEFRNMTDEARK